MESKEEAAPAGDPVVLEATFVPLPAIGCFMPPSDAPSPSAAGPRTSLPEFPAARALTTN
jgi:hypothetical protein